MSEPVAPLSLSDLLGKLSDGVVVHELTDGAPEDLVAVELVPVEVFGADDGYGLCDAVQAWSDCNRARGRIYRIEDVPGSREPDETLLIYVQRKDLPFFTRRFGDDYEPQVSKP